jgi:hypothetical protein
MRIRILGALAVCAVASFALPGFGQAAAGQGTDAHCVRQPFTARYKTTSEQTLANGIRIIGEGTQLHVEDSQGRSLSASSSQGVPEYSTYMVYDPVARTNTNWQAPWPDKKATVLPLPPLRPGQAGPPCPAASVVSSVKRTTLKRVKSTSSSSSTEITTEDLGTETIFGLEASGTRTTFTTPTGAIGNDAPLVRTTEVWKAKSLESLLVRSVINDPRSGKQTTELVELNQSEPDPTVFQPPADYKVVIQ